MVNRMFTSLPRTGLPPTALSSHPPRVLFVGQVRGGLNQEFQGGPRGPGPQARRHEHRRTRVRKVHGERGRCRLIWSRLTGSTEDKVFETSRLARPADCAVGSILREVVLNRPLPRCLVPGRGVTADPSWGDEPWASLSHGGATTTEAVRRALRAGVKKAQGRWLAGTGSARPRSRSGASARRWPTGRWVRPSRVPRCRPSSRRR